MYKISYKNRDGTRAVVLSDHRDGSLATYESYNEAEVCARHMRIPDFEVEEIVH